MLGRAVVANMSRCRSQHKFFWEEQMGDSGPLHQIITRRRLRGAAGVGALALSRLGCAQTMTDLPLPGGPGAREVTTAFPQKWPVILQRTRPPLLETPFEAFDQ